jgi:hypothetical protein
MIPKWIRSVIIFTCVFNLLACILNAMDGCWVDAWYELQIFLVWGLLFLYDKRVEVVIKHHRDERQNSTENH